MLETRSADSVLRALKALDPVDPIIDPAKIAPLADEFVCPSCRLVLHRSRKDPNWLLCRDCADDAVAWGHRRFAEAFGAAA